MIVNAWRDPGAIDAYIVDPGDAKWLVDLLEDAGWCGFDNTFEGPYPRAFSWQEIYYWNAVTRQDLEPHWCRLIKKLSGIYASVYGPASRDFAFPAPFDPYAENPE